MTPDPMLDAIETAIVDSSMARRAFREALELARAQLPPELEVVGGPGALPRGGVRPDDLLVRINPGEPVAPLVGRITSEATWSAGGDTADAEYSGPGYYTRVAPMYGPRVIRSRRVLDPGRRVPPNHILLRRRWRRRVLRRRPLYRVAPSPFASAFSRPLDQPSPTTIPPEPQEPIGIEPPELPEPGLEEPGLAQPGLEEPGIDEPGVEEPGLEDFGFEETLAEDQTCATEGTEAEQVNWWDAALAEDAIVANAPTELRGLLAYLHVSWPTFADHEGRYFAVLSERFRRQGLIATSVTLDRVTFADAVRRFQSKQGLSPDGIPGEQVLWSLQKDWAEERRLGIVRVDADRHPRSGGFDSFRLRSDIVDRYAAFRAAVRAAGGIVTSAGSLRDLEAEVTPGRSSTSMHYSGLALDLATDTGMQDPARDAYVVTQEGPRWRVWCKSTTAPAVTLNAVVWRAGSTREQSVNVNAFDFTAVARRHGFSPIGPRRDFPRNYLSAEWWHFQCEEPLVPYISQFGIELLSIDSVKGPRGIVRYDEATLSTQGLWANRMRIFRRGQNGWW